MYISSESTDTGTLKKSKNISKSLELVDEGTPSVVNRPLPPPPPGKERERERDRERDR